MSKDLKPKQRLGHVQSAKRKVITWTALSLLLAGAIVAAYHFTGTTEVDVPVARARRGDFVISVRTRGEIKSVHSVILSAPQVPNLRIVHLAAAGESVKKGDVVVAFDTAQEEQDVIERTTNVRAADSDIVQTKATHKMDDQADAMSQMSSEYDVERAKLDASKAEILSAIEGAKNRIQVGVTEGALQQVKVTVESHKVSHDADLNRLNQRKDKAVRDLDQAKSYLSKMEVRAPIDGIVNVLPNFRSGGSYGQATPPFKEGDSAWTGAAIAEIPDLSQMYVDLKLDEVDRGKLRMGQNVRVRVDAIPSKEFMATLDWISPIASLVYNGGDTEKTFPARATLKNLDERLRPGMSASAEIIIERDPNALLVPTRASFIDGGKPAVYVQQGQAFQIRHIEVGKRNDEDIVVTKGLKEGEMVTLESPQEAAKRAKKKF
ncbi:MAG TPA: efflux RND transporter periplasmic adaptor subunit [Bryobacteraceae bacterium]|nr:efflux RND transporter periplasmic adaptor subunit [Bryobacteraceae bacterium]